MHNNFMKTSLKRTFRENQCWVVKMWLGNGKKTRRWEIKDEIVTEVIKAEWFSPELHTKSVLPRNVRSFWKETVHPEIITCPLWDNETYHKLYTKKTYFLLFASLPNFVCISRGRSVFGYASQIAAKFYGKWKRNIDESRKINGYSNVVLTK